MKELNGKTALITGASRGIGAATARLMASKGMKVVLAARSLSDCEQVVAQIKQAGGEAIAVECDVAKYASVEAAVKLAVDNFGQLDILVNNAGIIDPIARIADSDPDSWDAVVDINLKGVYHGLKAVLPAMEKRGSGTIINISSGAATNALEGWSHYCATKAAVLSLTQCVHKEYAEHGIRCIGMSPGTVATDMQVAIKNSGINPVSQMDFSAHIPPEWPAQAITWLCTEAAAEWSGTDFSLKTEKGRRLCGII
ncbi:SDR family oxidoreductase [Granulosicoccus antarcticus]|uniref:3-oxoacyl-[acyl-carrier-protein] reductase 1 n=1 Tax=Granulosicoccus antarcticus IMCC3135 TaxID=1192854 RepID=A0A2Z2P374_9GAMM|nr:SDR family oxidoreductase [Granulosicoccus antarcticus]ASJ75850.1 3-oxoacyl-[acyl-carrier-protein] reductase 1 [Granulosicoccus antarcticus IMCC3135]